jgi:hypothetical protein
MTTKSQFAPLVEAPSSFRKRLVRKFRRTVKPLAAPLLSWRRLLGHRFDGVELGEGETRSLAHKIRSLEQRTDHLEWGREALVERMNHDDLRIGGLEERAETLYWGREALVERMNHDDAVFEEFRMRVDQQASLPLSFGLDYLAMGRRLAALEDYVEALLAQLAKAQDGQATTLVAFPSSPEKAAG